MSFEEGSLVRNDALLDLQQKLQERTARIGIIGLGYVGLPLTMLFARRGYWTLGIDIDANKVQRLPRGESYIRHISGTKIAELVEKKVLWGRAILSQRRHWTPVSFASPRLWMNTGSRTFRLSAIPWKK